MHRIEVNSFSVIPAYAGIQAFLHSAQERTWMPAVAGMTDFRVTSTRGISIIPQETLTIWRNLSF